MPLQAPLEAEVAEGTSVELAERATFEFDASVFSEVNEARLPTSLVGVVSFQVHLPSAGAPTAPEQGDHVHLEGLDRQGQAERVHPNAGGWIVQVGS